VDAVLAKTQDHEVWQRLLLPPRLSDHARRE
jgi:hypothetical protein